MAYLIITILIVGFFTHLYFDCKRIREVKKRQKEIAKNIKRTRQ
jgi:hypothetical protein